MNYFNLGLYMATGKSVGKLPIKGTAEVSKKAAAEGIVLLKNDGVLPLQETDIALFGAGANDTAVCGTGSGYAFAPYTVSVYQGLLNAGINVTSALWLKHYDAYRKKKEKEGEKLTFLQKRFSGIRKTIDVEVIEEDELISASSASTAIYCIYRNTGENFDRKALKGDYYLSDNEVRNIEILSDGLAMGKSSSSTKYGSVALAALTSARSEKLNLYSGTKDPLFFYGETVELSIKALVANKEAYSGIKVRFEGIVTKESGGGIYVESFDEDTQQSYGVYVYGGYSSLAPKFLVPGYKLLITGTADNNENFGFQVSGLSFSLINPTDDDTKIVEKDVPVVPTNITAEELSSNETLENTFVKIDNIKVNSAYTTVSTTSSDGAMTLRCTDKDGNAVTVRTVKLTKDGDTVTEEYFLGKTINVRGVVTYYDGAPQIKLFTLADAEIISN